MEIVRMEEYYGQYPTRPTFDSSPLLSSLCLCLCLVSTRYWGLAFPHRISASSPLLLHHPSFSLLILDHNFPLLSTGVVFSFLFHFHFLVLLSAFFSIFFFAGCFSKYSRVPAALACSGFVAGSTSPALYPLRSLSVSLSLLSSSLPISLPSSFFFSTF